MTIIRVEYLMHGKGFCVFGDFDNVNQNAFAVTPVVMTVQVWQFYLKR